PFRAPRARAGAEAASARGDRCWRQPRYRSCYLPPAPRALPLHMAESVAGRAHGARHRAGRHASVQGPLGGARRDPQAPRRPRPAVPPGRDYRRHFGKNAAPEPGRTQESPRMISFDTQPDRYHHWKLAFDAPVATLTLDVAEDKGLAP